MLKLGRGVAPLAGDGPAGAAPLVRGHGHVR